MGSTVVRLIQESAGVRLVGAVEWSGSPQINKDAGEVAGVGKVGVPITPQLAPLLQSPVVVIDFTTPEATLEHLKIAARKGAPIVIGTTGFNPKQLSEIKRLARRDRVFVSPNMSVGVNLLLSLLGRVAQTLGEDYDVEIVEAHHASKVDSPSGTAVRTAELMGQARGDLGPVAAPHVDQRARLDHQEAVAEGDPGPDVEDEAEAQRKEGRPEETVGDPAGVKMPESRVDERQDSRRFPYPRPPDLPQETVALLEPAGAFPAPLLLARAQDLAEHAILVAGSEKVFRAEEIHGSAILWPRAREKQWSEGNNHELPPRNL